MSFGGVSSLGTVSESASRKRGGILSAGLAHPLNHTVGVPNDASGDRGLRPSTGERGVGPKTLKSMMKQMKK